MHTTFKQTTFAFVFCGSLAAATALCACGSDTGGDMGSVGGDTSMMPSPPVDVASYTAGLQTSGDFDFEDSAERSDRVSFSAPITPRTNVLYPAEGKIPTDQTAEAALGHSASLTYPWLLEQCKPLYPGIVVPAAGKDLPAEQRAKNFNLVAQCAYEQYSGKPYWIPKLVNDLDLCGSELGKDYRLPTEADLATLGDADFRFLAERLSTPSSFVGDGGFYFSLQIFVRGSDGMLKVGDLSPGATTRISSLGVPQDSQYHLEHQPTALALRCFRHSAKSH